MLFRLPKGCFVICFIVCYFRMKSSADRFIYRYLEELTISEKNEWHHSYSSSITILKVEQYPIQSTLDSEVTSIVLLVKSGEAGDYSK